MDYTARLKKKHILDLIAYLKSAHKGHNLHIGEESSDDESVDQLAKSEYFDHSLFIGLMPDEDVRPLASPPHHTKQQE